MIQGGGYDAGHAAEAQDARADRERGEQRPEERCAARSRWRAPRSAFGDVAVLHQPRRQRHPRLSGDAVDGWGYAVFGKVVEGLDVVDKIAAMPTGARPAVRPRRAGHAGADQARHRGRRPEVGVRPRRRSAHGDAVRFRSAPAAAAIAAAWGIPALPARSGARGRRRCTSSATCSRTGSATTSAMPEFAPVRAALRGACARRRAGVLRARQPRLPGRRDVSPASAARRLLPDPASSTLTACRRC